MLIMAVCFPMGVLTKTLFPFAEPLLRRAITTTHLHYGPVICSGRDFCSTLELIHTLRRNVGQLAALGIISFPSKDFTGLFMLILTILLAF